MRKINSRQENTHLPVGTLDTSYSLCRCKISAGSPAAALKLKLRIQDGRAVERLPSVMITHTKPDTQKRT